MYIPFRFKILGCFLALFLTILAASLAIVHRALTRGTESDVMRQLETTRDVFRSILDQREKRLITSLSLLAGDYAFKQAVATTGDALTIGSAARNLQRRIGSDLVWVTNEEGRLYADTSGKFKSGRNVSHIKIVAQALEGTHSGQIQILGDRAYQLAAIPLNAPDTIGALAAGFSIDDAVAGDLKRLTRSEVSFAADGKLLSSTLPPTERAVLEKNVGTLAPDRATLLGKTPSRQIILPVAIAPQVTAYIQRSWDDALEPLRELQKLLILTGLAGFALMFFIGYLIADGVTASMRQLTAVTRKLLEGDYQVRVDISQKDEIGRLGEAFNRMIGGMQEKEKIRSLLRKTVSPEIAEELLKRGQIELGGEEKPVSILFCDIRNFTALSEGLAPKELVAQLNDYFIHLARAVSENQGVIDKYIGDAVMVLFGAPMSSSADAAHAQRAALAMRRALGELNRAREEHGQQPWRNGIGINTGSAIAGTMGSEDRWSYTVIGDAVNQASRLESLNKFYGTDILVSRATKEAGGDRFSHRALDLVRVKGKSDPIEIFELLEENMRPPEWLAHFDEGVKEYRDRRFAEAAQHFSKTLALKPDDHPSRLYLERIQKLSTGAPNGWDPAITMTEK